MPTFCVFWNTSIFSSHSEKALFRCSVPIRSSSGYSSMGSHAAAAGGAELRIRRYRFSAIRADGLQRGSAVRTEPGGAGVVSFAYRTDHGAFAQNGAGTVDHDLYAAGQNRAFNNLEDFLRHSPLAESADARGEGEGPGGEEADRSRADLVRPAALADSHRKNVADDHELGGDGETGAGDGFPSVAGLAGLEHISVSGSGGLGFHGLVHPAVSFDCLHNTFNRCAANHAERSGFVSHNNAPFAGCALSFYCSHPLMQDALSVISFLSPS